MPVEASSPVSSQPRCRFPRSVFVGRSASPTSGLMPSPFGWSVRYWRVSRTKNSASRPNAAYRYRSMTGPYGSDRFRSGIIS